MWAWIVSVHSRTFLTYTSDRLIAISGIAKKLLPEKRDTDAGQPYLAGMWRTSLRTELCWYLDDMDRTFHESKNYIAPSWSWASTNEPINYPWEPRDEFLYEILDATTTPLNENILGAVSHGNLRLSCSAFFRCKMSCHKKSGTRQLNGQNFIRIDETDFRYSLFLDRDIHSDGSEERELFLVPCYHHLKYFTGDTMGVWAMVLEATGDVRGRFRRCGQVGNLAPSAWAFDDDPWFPTLYNSISEAKDCAEVMVTEDGSKRYIIDIV